MTSSRRDFLKRGTWMALAAGIPLSLSEKVSAIGVTARPFAAGLSMEAFKAQLGTIFLVNHEATKVMVRLTDVANLASQEHTSSGKEGFSLLFRGPKNITLKQNTYLFEHQDLGMFSFLIVPIKTKDKRGQYYEAIVNRLYP